MFKNMKRYIILFISLSLGIGSVMASGILEYNGQNYFAGMMPSVWAIDFALNGVNEENDGFLHWNVINDNKFFFIEGLTDNFDIEEKITKNGFIGHGEKITIKELVGVPYRIIKNENGELQKIYVNFECIYYGEKIYYNADEETDLSITIIGYAMERKIIITEIILTEEEFEERENEFRRIDD
jgi:hypothetical protein